LGGLKLHGFVGLVYMAISAGFLLQTSHFGANQPKDLPSTRNFNLICCPWHHLHVEHSNLLLS
jgi:hypothetical protein